MENNNLTPEQVVEKINEKFNESLAGMPTKSDVDSLKSDVEVLKGLSEKSAEIEKAIARFEGKLEAMAEKSVSNVREPRTISECVVKAYNENIDSILETAQKGGNLNLDIKADTTITGSYTGDIALTQLEPGVNNIARPRIKVRDIVNIGTTNSKFVTYIAQGEQTEADWTLEAGKKVTGSPLWEEFSVEVKKIAGSVKVSKEMLADLSFIRAEINRDLMASVEQGMEYSLLNGAGGADLTGIIPSATPFAAGSFAASVPSANISDVILVAKSQIEGENHYPTHVVLHPADVAAMRLTKGTDGTYTYPIYYMDNEGNAKVCELIVVSTTNIAAGEFLVGDFTKSNVRIRENMNLQVGYVNDDFQRNMVTILAEMRLVHYVKKNDLTAFVTGNIAASIAAITL